MAEPKPPRRRAALLVSALALDALPAAFASGADLVCIDLEDPVPRERKDEARRAALAALQMHAPGPDQQLVVRVNALGSREGSEDLRAVLGARGGLGALLLPMARTADDVAQACRAADAAGSLLDCYAIIETPEGLENCAAIARSSDRLQALFFGGFDLSKALGCEMAWEPLLYARSRVVHAAALAGLECLDSPFPGVGDSVGLREACIRAKALGMTGKAAKHPSQVPDIRDVFSAVG